MTRFLILIFLCALLIPACTVGPNYKRPLIDTPPAFRGANSETNSLGDVPWWQLFQDPVLKDLIQTALTNNYDIRIAAARVEQSRALLAEARSGYYPQIGYEAGIGAGKNVSTAGTPSFTGEGAGKAVDFAGDVSWEIDLWGRVRRLSESARAQFFATQEARRNVTISLVASVAQTYFQLLAFDEQLKIARDATNSFGESLNIFSDRLKEGVASRLETSSAEALLDSQAATIPEFRRQIVAQEDQLSVLLGTNPAPILRQTVLSNVSLPDIPPGLPSVLLERRPDVRQAEQLLISANAQIGVAVANYYPQLELTGLFGRVSPEFAALSSGTSVAWEAAAGLTGPIFEGGLLRAQERQARAAWDATRLQYQSTIIHAFQEVSDALASREQLQIERDYQAKSVAAYLEAVKVARERYQGGQSSYYELLQEQQLLFPAEDTLTQAHLNQLLATVDLYKALGGGWNVPR
ncbi:MAG TPA: efflux transporter outer membrane subunit [Verrucomicrobiae bacterium]|jgi:multidrug efflux system outer membrane protein